MTTKSLAIVLWISFMVGIGTLSLAQNEKKTGSDSPAPTPSPINAGVSESLAALPSPSPSPPYPKKVSVTIGGGPFLNDPFTASYLLGVTFNYVFSEKSGLQLDIWNASSRDSDTLVFFENTSFQEPNHNIPQGYYGAHYTWTAFTSTIAANLGFVGKRQIPFEMTFAPGLGVTLLKSAEITAPPTYVPPPGTSQMSPTVALDLVQKFQIFDRWALRLDFVNHLYNETAYSSQNGSAASSHLTYNNAVLIGFGYSCTLPQPKPDKKSDTPDGAPVAALEPDTTKSDAKYCW